MVWGAQIRFPTFCTILFGFAATEPLKGISYGPTPSKQKGFTPVNDDFMVPDFKPLWGDDFRGDLAIMAQIGANAVRLYGNDPRGNPAEFFDTAHKHGLRVIPGLSNYPYTHAPNACSKNNWDCSAVIKDQYKQMLQNGFLQQDGSYHPALDTVIIINEPDYKAPGLSQPKLFCKTIISALDGILSAEKEVGVSGKLVKFTSTFSYGVCKHCSKHNHLPGLGQMYDLMTALLDPSFVGYSPTNDLTAAYRERFVMGLNTANPAQDMSRFVSQYKEAIDRPFFIGEYHSPHFEQAKDLQEIMKVVEANSDIFLGISFFQFQVAYNKGGDEMDFGMFGLGERAFKAFNAWGEDFTAWCLDGSIQDPHGTGGATILQAVQNAYGGPGVDVGKLCSADPKHVKLNGDGYGEVLAEKKTSEMEIFIQRVVEHMGGVVTDQSALKVFAGQFSGESSAPSGDWGDMVGVLASKPPSWASWDKVSAACVADRSASKAAVGTAVAYACSQMSEFDCSKIPADCKKDSYTNADYALSIYYNDVAGGADPLAHCSFDGAGIFQSREAYKKVTSDASCAVTRDPATTPLNQDGYRQVLATKDSDKIAKLSARIVEDELHEQVKDESALQTFASGELPDKFEDLMLALKKAPWTCGGDTGRSCEEPEPAQKSSLGPILLWSGMGVAAVVAILLLGVMLYKKKQADSVREVPQPGGSESQLAEMAGS